MLNSQSNVFFQEQYSTDQLPLQMIEEYDRVNGMDGQIEARESNESFGSDFRSDRKSYMRPIHRDDMGKSDVR